jgi:hypothetical protein
MPCRQRGLPRYLTLGIFTVLSFGGCADVIGLSDYNVVPPGAAGGAGSASGDAGSTGDAGDTASAGQSGSAGQAGAGNAGEAGGGGTDVVVGCDGVTPFSPNLDVVRSCLLRYSCNPFYPDDTISNCVTLNTQRTFGGTSLGCTLDANSCTDVIVCEGYGWAFDELCLGESGWRCQGNLAVNYDGNTVVDCTIYGGVCSELADGTTDCKVLDSCTASDVDRCGGTNNDTLYNCVDGVGYGFKCSHFGSVCEQRNGDEGCYFTSTSCADPGTNSCMANRRRTCSTDGLLRLYDCASVGLSCSDQECTAPGCTRQDVLDCVESCQGTQLSFCYGGTPMTVDCNDYGFPQCGEYTHPSGWEFATCTY